MNETLLSIPEFRNLIAAIMEYPEGQREQAARIAAEFLESRKRKGSAERAGLQSQ